MVRAGEAAGLQGGHGRDGRRLSNSEQTPAGKEGDRETGDEAAERQANEAGNEGAVGRSAQGGAYIPAWEDPRVVWRGPLPSMVSCWTGSLGLEPGECFVAMASCRLEQRFVVTREDGEDKFGEADNREFSEKTPGPGWWGR